MKNVEKKIALLLLFIATSMSAQIGVGTKTPHPDAMLEVVAANKGILLPRVALTATTSVAPLSAHVVGMTVYNTATTGDVSPGYYYNDGAKWIKLGTGQGAPGVAGADGKSILNGTTSPSAFVGTDGDFYINTISNTIFGPKVSGAWPLTGISIVGATGVKGDKGDQGEVGPAGSDATVTGTAPISVASGVVSLIDGGISTSKLADAAVTTDKIGNGAVSVAKLDLGTATTGQVLKYDGTTWAPAADEGLTTTTVSNSITSGALTTTVNGVAATAVTLPVADGSETKVNAGTNVTVTGSGTTLSPYVVNATGASDATTTTNGIVRLAGDLSGTAAAPAVANNAITSSKILDGTITDSDLATNSITTDKIGNGAVSIAKLDLGTATTGQVLKYDGTTWAPAADEGLTATTVSNSITSGSLTTTVNGVAATAVSLPVADGSETKVDAGTNVTITGAGTTTSPYLVNSAIETAIQTPSTAIVGSATQVAVPSTNVQDALGDLAREVKTAGNNLYTSNGTLTENRTVTQGANTLGFTSTATTGTNHFNVDGSTLNVDAVNNRIGIGTFTPSQRLTVSEGNIRIQSSQLAGGIFGQLDFFNTAGFSTRPRAYISAYREGFSDHGMLNFAVSPTTDAVPSIAMTIRETGNIGIGTTTPSTNFHTIGGVRFQGLAGTGSRMVVADASGVLSTQDIQSASTSVVLNAGSFERAALTGDVTAAQNSNALTISNGAVTAAKLATMGASTGQVLKYNGTAWAPAVESAPLLSVTSPLVDNYTVQDTDSVIYRNITAAATITFPSTLPAGKVFYLANTSMSFDWALAPTPINTGLTVLAAGSSLMVVTLGGGNIMVVSGY